MMSVIGHGELAADRSKKLEMKTHDVNLEKRLNMKDLEHLQDAFMHDGNGYDNKLSLTREQFSEALLLILNKGSAKEYGELFDKIDVTKEGTVDWDKFASHMLLGFYELDDRVKSTQVPQWKKLRVIPAPHKEIIQRVAYMSNRYISISREGTVAIWSPSVSLTRTIKSGTETCQARDLWVTDFVCLHNINKIALSFTSKEIAIYDLSSKLDFNCQFKLHALAHTPLCLEFWSDPENSNIAILAWGDTSGAVNSIHFTSASIALFERPVGVGADNPETTLNIAVSDVIKAMYRNCTYTKHVGHAGWVRQVMFSPHLDCLISCATTWQNSVVIGWLEKHSTQTKFVTKTTTIQISQGVNAFDYTSNLNLIATAGVNHHVLLWNPYVVSKPNGVMRGHMAPVVQVKFNNSRGQLISFSKDKVMRIWDVQLQICIQRLAGIFPKGPEVTSVLLLNEERNHLFITFNALLTLLEMKADNRDRVVSHDKPVVAALYNPGYNQVVTAGQDGLIVSWMLDTGQKVKHFNSDHGSAEITTLTQDLSTNHLFTASTDGTLKVWDFNGHCHHVLTCAGGNPADVGLVVLLKRSLVALGWSRHITVFRNNLMRSYHVEPSDWKGGQEHMDDILAASFDSPSFLATGSYDGEIIVWNVNSEQPVRRLNQRSRRQYQKTRGRVVGNEPTTSVPGQKSVNDLGFDSHIDRTDSCNVRPKSRIASRISTGSDDDQNEFGFAISRLCYLETRKGRSSSGGANLVSCGGNGWVRFWNTHDSFLVAEFTAHKQVGSIIMSVDMADRYLITADVDGRVKVWLIDQYCLCRADNSDVITEPPPLQAQFQPHIDMVTTIDTCQRQDRTLIITASLDGAVALSDVYGNVVGVFGQEEHWRIEPFQPPSVDEQAREAVAEMEEDAQDFQEVLVNEDVNQWEFDPLDAVRLDECRESTRQSTILGKGYQELRVQKRERRQPSTIRNLPYLCSVTLGVPLAGPHSALETSQLDEPISLMKPDFIANPEKYFRTDDDEYATPKTSGRLPQLAESLRAAFDERTLLPKYILDFEAKMRLDHQAFTQTQQAKASRVTGGSVSHVVNFALNSRPASPKGRRGTKHKTVV